MSSSLWVSTRLLCLRGTDTEQGVRGERATMREVHLPITSSQRQAVAGSESRGPKFRRTTRSQALGISTSSSTRPVRAACSCSPAQQRIAEPGGQGR